MENKLIKIMPYLRQNARESLKKISKKTNIPISTIFDRLRIYEKSIIEKHTALINFERLGFNARAKILIKADKTKREELKDFIKRHSNINSAYKINNGYDFLIEAVFRSIKEIEEFVSLIESRFNTTDFRVFYVVDNIKREGFLSDPESAEVNIGYHELRNLEEMN